MDAGKAVTIWAPTVHACSLQTSQPVLSTPRPISPCAHILQHGLSGTVPCQTTVHSWSVSRLLAPQPDTSFDPHTGAYKSLVERTLPDPDSPDYTPTLVYQARAHLALGDALAAAALVPTDTENVALKAVAALAHFIGAETGAAKEAERDAALEELRDVSVEIEGEDADASEWEKGTVRVLAGTAFARAGEIEEALETLGAGNDTRNLEA